VKAITKIEKLQKQAGCEVTILLTGRVKLDDHGAVGIESEDGTWRFVTLYDDDFEHGALVLKGDK
jgi:hypothetical protein